MRYEKDYILPKVQFRRCETEEKGLDEVNIEETRAISEQSSDIADWKFHLKETPLLKTIKSQSKRLDEYFRPLALPRLL
jgi:hypothetical protein